MTEIVKIAELLDSIREKQPLIHCITNHISIGDCANILLALGARPIMAEHPAESADITASSKALAVNLGNISTARMDAIKASGEAAHRLGIPIVIDLVGVGVSRLRLDFALDFCRKYSPAVIKGNLAEVRAFLGEEYRASGVDSLEEFSKASAVRDARELARRYSAVAVISGKIDAVSNGDKTYLVENGHPYMSRVTGTGCMLNALIGAYISSADPLTGALAATVTMGLCGEYAGEIFERSGRISDFHAALIDGAFVLNRERFNCGRYALYE